jgi:hypothetical protein
MKLTQDRHTVEFTHRAIPNLSPIILILYEFYSWFLAPSGPILITYELCLDSIRFLSVELNRKHILDLSCYLAATIMYFEPKLP